MERDLIYAPYLSHKKLPRYTPAPLTMPSRLTFLALCLPLLLHLCVASPSISAPALAPARPLASFEQGRGVGEGASRDHAATAQLSEMAGGMLRLRGGSQVAENAAAMGVQVRDAALPSEAGLSRFVARPLCCRRSQSPTDRAPAVGLQRMLPLCRRSQRSRLSTRRWRSPQPRKTAACFSMILTHAGIPQRISPRTNPIKTLHV